NLSLGIAMASHILLCYPSLNDDPPTGARGSPAANVRPSFEPSQAGRRTPMVAIPRECEKRDRCVVEQVSNLLVAWLLMSTTNRNPQIPEFPPYLIICALVPTV